MISCRKEIRAGLLFSIVLLVIISCSKDKRPASPKPLIPPVQDEIIRIPVVVHVIYSEEQLNISDDKIRSQIKVLNEDFRKRNPDQTKVPTEYKDRVGDAGIEFELASIDPHGNSTNGITRTRSEIMGWHGRVTAFTDSLDKLPLYLTNKGGHDAWPRDKYLNIWIADLSDRNGNVILAGYAQLPGAPAAADGVVIDPRCFGTLAPLTSRQSLGRTATHEIGHWLSLYHIFANPSDDVDDTPRGCSPNLSSLSTKTIIGCLNELSPPSVSSEPFADCGPSPMTMNFMDYVSDQNMYMFTNGQVKRMRAMFEKGGAREALFKNNVRLIAHK